VIDLVIAGAVRCDAVLLVNLPLNGTYNYLDPTPSVAGRRRDKGWIGYGTTRDTIEAKGWQFFSVIHVFSQSDFCLREEPVVIARRIDMSNDSDGRENMIQA
jgi:hypothetical protein